MWPPVGLDEPGHDVGAAPLPSVALGEHGVRLADAGGRAEVDAEMTGRLDLADDVCIRRGFTHAHDGTTGTNWFR